VSAADLAAAAPASASSDATAPTLVAPPVVVPNCETYAQGSHRDLAESAGDWLYFAAGADDLDDTGWEFVRSQVVSLQHNPGVHLTLAGYADERGTRDSDLKLGLRRAERVRDGLISHGVRFERLKIVSYGKDGVLPPGAPKGERDPNRAVHLLVDAPMPDQGR
jgi:peptidoglycan-associated lipoprotein